MSKSACRECVTRVETSWEAAEVDPVSDDKCPLSARPCARRGRCAAPSSGSPLRQQAARGQGLQPGASLVSLSARAGPRGFKAHLSLQSHSSAGRSQQSLGRTCEAQRRLGRPLPALRVDVPGPGLPSPRPAGWAVHRAPGPSPCALNLGSSAPLLAVFAASYYAFSL